MDCEIWIRLLNGSKKRKENMQMKKTLAVTVLVVITAASSFAGLFGGEDALSKEKAETAVVLLNHLNWVVSRVEQNKNNSAVIEEEYENLTDNNINLSTIEDEEAAHEIVALMGVFTDIRKVIMDLDCLHECVELQRKGAIYKAIPSPGAILVPNPYLIALRLAECAATSYMNYQNAQNEILLGFIKQENEIEKNRLSALNAINEELFWRQWQLAQKHSLDDAWRTARSDCRELVAILSVANQGDDSKSLVYSFLKRNEARFSYLPIYWYYRMLYALTHVPGAGEDDVGDAVYASEMYERRYRPIIRKDRIRASVSMMTIGAKKEKMPWSELRRHLEIITSNTKTHDWDLAYFVAREYIANGYKKEAIEVLQGMVDNLEALYAKFAMSQRCFDITSMKTLDPIRKKGTMENVQPHTSFPGHGLFLCRTLLNNLCYDADRELVRKRIVRLMTTDAENKYVSLAERIVYAKLLGGLDDISLRREIKKVSLMETDDGFRIGAIRPWLIGEKEKLKIRVTAIIKGGQKKAIDLTPDFKQNAKTGTRYVDSNDAFGDVVCALSGKKITDFSSVEVDLIFGEQGSEDGAVKLIFENLKSGTTPPCAFLYSGMRTSL